MPLVAAEVRGDFYAGVIALCAVTLFAKFVVQGRHKGEAGKRWRILHCICVGCAAVALGMSLVILAWTDAEATHEDWMRAIVFALAALSAAILAIDVADSASDGGAHSRATDVLDAIRRLGDTAKTAQDEPLNDEQRIEYVERAGTQALGCAESRLTRESRDRGPGAPPSGARDTPLRRGRDRSGGPSAGARSGQCAPSGNGLRV